MNKQTQTIEGQKEYIESLCRKIYYGDGGVDKKSPNYAEYLECLQKINR
jgi:hypothetical protein